MPQKHRATICTKPLLRNLCNCNTNCVALYYNDISCAPSNDIAWLKSAQCLKYLYLLYLASKERTAYPHKLLCKLFQDYSFFSSRYRIYSIFNCRARSAYGTQNGNSRSEERRVGKECRS